MDKYLLVIKIREPQMLVRQFENPYLLRDMFWIGPSTGNGYSHDFSSKLAFGKLRNKNVSVFDTQSRL